MKINRWSLGIFGFESSISLGPPNLREVRNMVIITATT